MKDWLRSSIPIEALPADRLRVRERLARCWLAATPTRVRFASTWSGARRATTVAPGAARVPGAMLALRTARVPGAMVAPGSMRMPGAMLVL